MHSDKKDKKTLIFYFVRGGFFALLLSALGCALHAPAGFFDGANAGSGSAATLYTVIQNWPDTGQFGCSAGVMGNGTLNGCPQTVVGQDGDYTNVPAPRSYAGPTAHAVYTTDYTTQDNTTGLLWKTCSEGLSGSACATGSMSSMNFSAAVAQCASLNTANGSAGYAGRTNWRLPTLPELETIISYGSATPAVDASAFPATGSLAYWTQSIYQPDSTNAWIVVFNYGFASYNVKTISGAVRCVAANTPMGAQVFTDLGDGTVKEARTNLIWQKCGQGQVYSGGTCTGTLSANTWQSAISYCKNTLSLAGRTWRLPSMNELNSIGDVTRASDAIDSNYFPQSLNNFWSSTSRVDSPLEAWYVNFTLGNSTYIWKSNTNTTRCVSTGP